MENKSFLRSEIVERGNLNTCPFSNYNSVHAGISCDWLLSLLSGLEAAGEDISEVCSVLRAASESEHLSHVRCELSRIPVWYRLITYLELGANKISTHEVCGVRSVCGRTYKVGSWECPASVLPRSYPVSAYKRGLCVQCFYPLDLARQLGLELPKLWDMSDSIVDWICDFSRTEGLRTTPRLSIEKVGDDVCYKMSHRGTALSGNDGNSAIDRLYNFIVKNAPVSTQELLSEGFASRRQTFNHLRRLENDGKIERVGHGIYIAL